MPRHPDRVHGAAPNRSRLPQEGASGIRPLLQAGEGAVELAWSLRSYRPNEMENVVNSQEVNPPLVSVIVPTRGRPELLRETLRSIVQQDYLGDIEIIVVHDGEPADRTLCSLSTVGREVFPFKNEGTPGLAGARNNGLSRARGDYIASCDDDDLWARAKVRRQVERLECDPRLLVVGAGIRLVMSADHVVEWPGKAPIVGYDRLLRNRVKELHSSTLMMRRIAFAKAGRYDEGLPHGYGEDYDWLLRAARVGRVGVVTEVLADIRKDVPSWFRGKAQNTADALEYMLAKHPDIASNRRGAARIYGQIAFAQASAGQKAAALRNIGRAASRDPLARQVWLAAATVAGVSPQRLLSAARRAGFGLS